ncbi:MAG: sugar phosphate isomerase/epimerase family protein [Candidatus Woesearchaeota archaeon]|jgi:sugar phosphate isomerase/epimerase|nr:sugar phosphate isomerase/epimerase family protein [Candidatus Woesearchaeota archaeon]MDP7323526.1 sugar phosphate isomerase/epimerase family protein [Candidatus Woesearchaeota archaeon]MDP7458581.1 sugar phosphate isomerase/epimerase family protein [Candidatus Woesearchaeota archaeon]
MVYVSTACLKGRTGTFETDFYKVLQTYVDAGIRQIELGSAHFYFSDLSRLFKMQKEHELTFTVHTFFPPLKEQLWVNIASTNKDILDKSLKVALNAVELCRKVEAPIYTIHAGYLVDFKAQHELEAVTKPVPYDQAHAIFMESLKKILSKAEDNDITIGLETQHDKHGEMLMAQSEEFIKLFSEIKSKNLGILFDFGHVYSNAGYYGFKPKDYIDAIKKWIIAFHIHEGDGRDAHLKVSSLDFFSDFPKEFFKDKFLTLEVNRLKIDEILQQQKLLEGLE